jgi:hypothetical protein
MANLLNTDKRIAIISALSEGSSIRSIERMTGVHRDTIMRLGVKVDGIVEVFHLKGHPKTDTVYAWLHDTGDPEQPFRPVTVLHIHPALSPVAAVRAFIVQEFRANANAAEAQESRTPQTAQRRSQRQDRSHAL